MSAVAAASTSAEAVGAAPQSSQRFNLQNRNRDLAIRFVPVTVGLQADDRQHVGLAVRRVCTRQIAECLLRAVRIKYPAIEIAVFAVLQW